MFCRIDITKYERDVGLDQYIDHKLRKRKGTRMGSEQIRDIDNNADHPVCKKTRETFPCSSTSSDGSGNNITDSPDDKDGKTTENLLLTKLTTNDSVVISRDELQDDVSRNVFHFPHSRWNFDDIRFPNIEHENCSNIVQPLKQYLPAQVEVSEFTFDVEEYKSRRKAYNNNREMHVDPSLLQFSHEMPKHGPKTTAKNWTEYKEILKDGCLQDTADVESPARHLWEGEVTPLVKPTDATNTSMYNT